ncbi:MAG TPA: alpha/beta hydrolase [Myxococcales bacterium]|nr:alpha/beta hydrolase [Myxococcales bacterium]
MTVASLVLSASAALGAAPKHGYAPVNGLRMYYEIHGKGRPLVLLHGGGSTIQTSFARLLPPLARTRQVIAFEQQGHGRTADVEDRPFSFEQSADDAAALLRHLRIEQADFLGFSNGGSIALQIAVRHPGLVRRLVVISAIFDRSGMTPEFWQSMEHASLDSMPAELKQAYLAAAPHPEQLQTFHDKSVKRMVEFKGWPKESIRGIGAPTMVIVGDGDVVRPEHAVEMFRLLPHGELAILPGATHGLIVEKADLLAAMVLPFLDAESPP